MNFKDIVACLQLSPRDPSLQGILRPLVSFRDDTPLTTCLERLIHEHTHIALIRDLNQQVIGMLTLEDILEELVGEINDEFDRLPAQITPTGFGWLVGGGTPVEAVRSATHLALPDVPGAIGTVTLNDWLLRHLGRPVKSGEELRIETHRVLIRKTRRNTVLEAVISSLDQPASHATQKPAEDMVEEE